MVENHHEWLSLEESNSLGKTYHIVGRSGKRIFIESFAYKLPLPLPFSLHQD